MTVRCLSRSQAITRSGELGLLRVTVIFNPSGGWSPPQHEVNWYPTASRGSWARWPDSRRRCAGDSVALFDPGRLETGAVTSSCTSSVFSGFRFPREVIAVAVRWYLRYGLPYRDVEELLAERGVTVDHVTIYRWVQRFTPEFIEAARPCRHAPGDRWFVDETYVKVAGQWTYLYRAVDQHGQVIDVLLSVRRDLTAARRFFTRTLRAGIVPAEVTTDRAPAYPRVLDELMRGLKRYRSARILAAGHAFVQNLRRGHYDIATHVPARHQLRTAFDELALTI